MINKIKHDKRLEDISNLLKTKEGFVCFSKFLNLIFKGVDMTELSKIENIKPSKEKDDMMKLEKLLRQLENDSVVVICGKASSDNTGFLKELCENTDIALQNPNTTNFVINRIVKEKGGVAIDEAEGFIERNKHNKIINGLYALSVQDTRDNDFKGFFAKMTMIEDIFGKNRIKIVCL